MNEGWRTTLAASAVVVATLSAVFLLWQNPSHYGAAIALMVGAILIAIVLSSTPLLSYNGYRFSSHDYKNLVASVISLGGGVVVAFSLVFILLKITGYSWTNGTHREALSEAISLPLIVIVGVTVLLIVIALVTYTFSVIGLSSGRDALGLPDGSVRAIIALMLLVLFSILSIFLYNSIASRPVQTITHVSQGGIDDLRSHAIVIVKELEPPADNQGGAPGIQAAGAATGPTYKVTFRELTGPADDIAKQLIVMLGTLVTAVASFYFGSASVASANAAVLGQKRSEPLASSVSPNPIVATGQSQTLMIGGSNLAGTTKLHLEQKDQPDINATLVKATDNLLTALISIQSDKGGTWNVVTDDGSRAVTIGSIEIASPAASVTEAAKPVDPAAAGGAADTSLHDATGNPAIAAAQPGAETLAESGKPVEKISANSAINTPLPGNNNNPAIATAFTAELVEAAMFVIPATINRAFLGHGMFLEYAPITTLRRYAGYGGADPTNATSAQMIERFVRAMQDMHIGSVWIQLFSASGALDSGNEGTKELVAALKLANIGCAGWGYCYHGNAATDAGLAKHLCGINGIEAFVADVEPGNTVHGTPDTWQPKDFTDLIAGLKATFGKDNLGISTFGNLSGHDDAAKIYRLAANDVAFFAPQIYWYQKVPVDYTKACIASFRQAGIGTPLVGTTQAYWEVGKTGGVSRATMETKVQDFVTGFADWDKVIGLNWYHGGNANTPASGSMSDAMIVSIGKARLDQKSYSTPAPADAAVASA